MSFHKKVLIAVVLLNLYLISTMMLFGEPKLDRATATDQDLIADAMAKKLWPLMCALVSGMLVAIAYATRGMLMLAGLMNRKWHERAR